MSRPYIPEALPAAAAAAAAAAALPPPDPLELLSARPVYSNLLDDRSLKMASPLSLQKQMDMRKSIQEIFDLREEDQAEDVDMDSDDDDDDDEPGVDLEDQAHRTERLRGALSILANLWWANSEHMDFVAEKLADGSRDPKWRIPLGDSGILNFFLEILSTHDLRHQLKIHTLRLVGNSCADTDENRARVVASNSLPSVISNLNDTSLLAFAIPVLYNICIDYEPAQLQASRLGLSKEFIDLISSSRFHDSRAFLTYTCKILALLVTQPSEADLAPDNTAVVLLKIAADRESPVDMDDFTTLVNTAVSYLQHEKFQKALIQQGALDITLSILIDSYTRFDSHPVIGSAEPDEEDAKALSEMRSHLNQVLSDISALPEFKEAVPIISPFTNSLRRWLSSPQLQLQVCACIILGNLARSDAACEEFVHTAQVHKPLITILTGANDSQLLHAALGFLKNLALPAKNKILIGDTGIFDILPRLWALDTLQQIQFSSISLARQLVTGSCANVKRICSRLTLDEASPANNHTQLSLLIDLFGRSDVEPTKMEISRLVTAVCRVSHSSSHNPNYTDDLRRIFFEKHPDIGRPLSFMVSQTKWPVVRSEGWFTFALMARTPEGARCISDLMQDPTVFQPLVELLTGQNVVEYKSSYSPSPSTSTANSSATTSPDAIHSSATSTSGHDMDGISVGSPQQNAHVAEMQRIDRENALVLVSEMLKNRGDQMAVMRKTLFEDLLKGGGELILSYKEARPNWGDAQVRKERKARAKVNLQEAAAEVTAELL